MTDVIEVRSRARDLLLKGWKIAEKQRGVSDFLLYAPLKIATNVLGIKVTQIEEILNFDIPAGRRRTSEVVGILDQRDRANIRIEMDPRIRTVI